METSIWISNKIGSDDSNWSTTNIASSFTVNTMKNIYDSFLQLDVKVKIKIMLAVLEIPLHSIVALKEPIDNIVNLAESDPDEWVRVAANIVKDYPTLHTIDKRIETITFSFQETIQNIKDELKTLQSSNLQMVPLESSYLNRAALNQIVPNQLTPMKHFTLRRRPKSAELRAKITQKATDAANQRRAQTSTNPSKILKRASSLPSNPLPPVTHSKLGISKASSLPKKTKLLDIGEQPLGVREQKKRKKVLAMEASLEEAKQRKQAGKLKSIEEDEEKAAPAYAGGENVSDSELHTPSVPSEYNKTTNSSNVKHTKLTTPAYALLPGSSSASTLENPVQHSTSSIPSADPNTIQNSGLNLNEAPDLPAIPKLNRDTPSEVNDNEIATNSNGNTNADPNTSYNIHTLQRELQMRMQQEHELRLQHEQQFNQQLFQQHNRPYGGNIPMGAAGSMSAPTNMTADNNMGLPYQLPPLQNPHVGMPAQPMQPTQRKKELSLTRDQMIAAQEMFRSANRVTRLEKELILGFMAGARENPFPNQGPVIIIKLSEDEEYNEQSNESMKIEMLFEMNYETGHWRRLKKTRVVSKQNSAK